MSSAKFFGVAMNTFGKWSVKIITAIFDQLAHACEMLEIGRTNYEQRH